ncbi:lipopolysaccharide assembly protein B [Cupriavidus metallidurans]|jgi:lipopolysaccharide biosynthesis regulator YciM|uniref:Lipopolysaccharide assembly protein B n=1 Tax=Cupriavidus metallidurans (strain ATCC 43123 / DSM 2839 / NBRC 102507 / CH34) TaxID=266264 RepID=Q1LQG5_CUPMC|nr:lipopolysaccharide assembly protein LapB [Cupriavidus metallidurans]ABF07611.1 putative N-Acetylglucosaminyl transferase; Tetratricopeptide TPR repeat protein [Cupriavidus metallidurans CH34]AVA32858.1 lipopolysaccharide assembly protein LapB [Cupriavidus metallidurans]MDE4917041.1 lipopolysaccharide assembly protein LapB [Cupriavidus metallidurans]QGS28079.1 lipopolysaccharide assembly protein LapB [Cupriavidus metallidurans]UBM11760.1 lipopolysaccharide assembly protein LapB [Cupriavidus 
MMFETWWLLALPLVFGLGWMAARFDLRQLISEQGALPRSYFKGLNFLLNEQPDQAIDAFVEVARLDPETTELHFALGALFRRRGETERAIRVHQNLATRPDLPEPEREHALYELGQDFLRAGLLDRAEESLRRLMSGPYAASAKRVLLELYEVEKEWQKAIEAARELQALDQQDYRVQIAQFCCELAQDALLKKRPEDAVEWLRRATQENPANVRAPILLGDVSAAGGDTEGALKQWLAIEAQDAAYVPLVADKVVKAYAALGEQGKALEWLHGLLKGNLAPELLDTAYRTELEVNGPVAAATLMREQLRRQPTLLALTKYFEAQAAENQAAQKQSAESAEPAEGGGDAVIDPQAQETAAIRDLLQLRTRNLARYTCRECGFRARLFYWQCPGCNRWETYAPRRSEALG